MQISLIPLRQLVPSMILGCKDTTTWFSLMQNNAHGLSNEWQTILIKFNISLEHPVLYYMAFCKLSMSFMVFWVYPHTKLVTLYITKGHRIHWTRLKSKRIFSAQKKLLSTILYISWTNGVLIHQYKFFYYGRYILLQERSQNLTPEPQVLVQLLHSDHGFQLLSIASGFCPSCRNCFR